MLWFMINTHKVLFAVLVAGHLVACTSAPISTEISSTSPPSRANPLPLTQEQLRQDTFRFFWETTSAQTGLAPDRYPSESPASIAAIGFALTAYGVGVENGYITRKNASERTLTTLRYLWALPMGSDATDVAGYKGFFYHFLSMESGTRYQGWQVELSTVDTALLLAGVLFAQSYFDQDTADEAEIRTLADKLYHRVDWQWAQHNKPLIELGWYPEKGFTGYDWVGYNEAMLVYILALASPTYPIEKDGWDGWVDYYEDDWQDEGAFKHLSFGPMFGHQYSHIWIDFRDIQDEYMKDKGIDYFINSTIATYAQQAYAIHNPLGWKGYDKNVWGITASDGPGNITRPYRGSRRAFRSYSARGVALTHDFDDGTLAPTALGGSLPFAPEIVWPALQHIKAVYGEHLYGEYGFLDAFNPSFQYDIAVDTGIVVPDLGWFAKDYIGIDQGAMLLMIENHQSELIWRIMHKNPYIRRGLIKAGFTGGWLDLATSEQHEK